MRDAHGIDAGQSFEWDGKRRPSSGLLICINVPLRAGSHAADMESVHAMCPTDRGAATSGGRTADALQSADAKILIVYFSRTGVSRRVAEELRTLLGVSHCDIEAVREVHPGRDGRLRRAFDALTGNLPGVHPRELHPWRYTLVVVGGPVHAGLPAAPLRSFVRGLALHGSEVALFLVGGRRPRMRAFADLQRHLGRTPLAQLWVPAAEVTDGLHAPRLRSFCATLRGALQAIGTRTAQTHRRSRAVPGDDADVS
ncbi:flavodoxin family protein [Chiayiivirga flava]|uniref:Menaquinone-dependent protoporphyrinogen IX oxidase n=1 Tax=Chiayiivirga flava TaxID=659595 RepID=A0A7W8FXY5_9GAMM|nr:hypothetical protein [Chiayiivirga flava]MBB5206541.1 menaquinone-dependent protoporphyrinogen IX oxidase [Chiayiivirga flava]